MKPIAILLFSVCCFPVFAQEHKTLFLEAGQKSEKRCVILNGDVAMVYILKAFTHSKTGDYRIVMQSTDTLHLHPNGSWLGYSSKITKENGIYYLNTGSKKRHAWALGTVKDLSAFNFMLNYGYFLKHYSLMIREINNTYPLQHIPFPQEYRTWRGVQHKSADFTQFTKYIDQRINEARDSINGVNRYYTTVSDDVRQRIGSMSYEEVKEKAGVLLAEGFNRNKYYVEAVNEVAKRKPEYFFRLAQDFPGDKMLIFYAVEKNRDVINGLRSVSGYDEVKNEFFKRRK